MQNIHGTPERYKNATLDNADRINPDIVQMGRDFIDKHAGSERNLVISGGAGLGKTYFTWCLYHGLVEKYKRSDPFRFIKAKILDDTILEKTREYGSASYYISTIKESGVLFIDDFGIDRGSERTERDYYDILDGRWEEEKPTVITTNLNPRQIENAYGQRIFSRLKDFKWIRFEGADLRGRK